LEDLSAERLREVATDAQNPMSQCQVCKAKGWNNPLPLLPYNSSLVWKAFAQNIFTLRQHAMQIPKPPLTVTL
jgi:hypothetical protein